MSYPNLHILEALGAEFQHYLQFMCDKPTTSFKSLCLLGGSYRLIVPTLKFWTLSVPLGLGANTGSSKFFPSPLAPQKPSILTWISYSYLSC